MAESKKQNLEEKVIELEAKIRKLEEEHDEGEEEKDEEAGGIAGGLLQQVGNMFGLGGLLKGLGKSPAFQERLKRIDEEIETKFREEPLKRVDEGERGPITRSSFSVRTLADSEPPVKKAAPIHRVKRKVDSPKELAIDVFDEGDYLTVIAELPGVEENDIRIAPAGDKLTISTDVPHHRYHGEVDLPCPVKSNLEKSYKKGILEIRLEKA